MNMDKWIMASLSEYKDMRPQVSHLFNSDSCYGRCKCVIEIDGMIYIGQDDNPFRAVNNALYEVRNSEEQAS